MGALSATVSHLPSVSTGSLSSYISTVKGFPVLDREEEVQLFTRFQNEGDLDAARTIVLAHLRYVVYIANSYRGYGLPLEDLIQQGSIGLMKSVKRFDLHHEVRLVTFAVYWIKAEIHEFILKNWRLVKVATTKAQRKLFFNLRKSKKNMGWLNTDEVAQIASDLGVKQEEVREMESRLSSTDESYDPPSYGVDEDEHPRSPAGYLTYEGDGDPQLLVSEEEIRTQQEMGLDVALGQLDERSLDIVRSRWLSDEKVGLKALSEKYGVSMERIRQIESKALENMQGALLA